MAVNKKNKSPVLEIVIISILVVLIAVMLVIYFSFSDTGNAPKIFGYYIYRTHAVNMEPAIPSESAVFASEKEKDNIGENSVVLCRVDDNLTIIRVVEKLEEDSGEYYIVRFDTSPSAETYKIPAESIIAKAVYYDEFTGTVLNFAASERGVVCLAIIPSILIVIYEVIKIIVIQKKSSESDEESLDEAISTRLESIKNEKEKSSESPLISYNDYIPPKNKAHNSHDEDEEKLPVGRFKPAKSVNNVSENENDDKKISEEYIGRFALDFKNEKKAESSEAVNNEEMILKSPVRNNDVASPVLNVSPVIPTFREDKEISPKENNAANFKYIEKPHDTEPVTFPVSETLKSESKAVSEKNKKSVNIDELFKMIDDEQMKLRK